MAALATGAAGWGGVDCGTFERRLRGERFHPEVARQQRGALQLLARTESVSRASAGRERVGEVEQAARDPGRRVRARVRLEGVLEVCNRVLRSAHRRRQESGAFLLRHYERGLPGALALGRRHGLFCLGCCWALMLLMFAAGVANLWWMAGLTALMVYEKTGAAGRRAVPVGGIALLVCAALVLAHPQWLPALLGGATEPGC